MKNNRDFKGVWIPREVWLDTRLNALDKIILTEIDSLDIGDDHFYGSNEYLAEFCQCSERKVSATISKLIEYGYVKVVSFDGRRRTLQSRLSNFSDQTSKNCKADKQNFPHNNIDNNIENKKDNIFIFDDEIILDRKEIWFNEFWNEYIKKVGKADAEKKFKKACTNEETFSQIMVALRKQNIESYSKRDKQYVPNPSTWLNQRRWEDEIIKESTNNIVIDMPDYIRDQENGIIKESKPASKELLEKIKAMQESMK